MLTTKTDYYPELSEYITRVEASIPEIGEDRRERLDELAEYIRGKQSAGEQTKLVFICTHNSRRSQISQVMAALAADYYSVGNIQSFSGGTEVTAFNPRAVAAMKRAGFHINSSETENPRYEVNFGKNSAPVLCFSKTYDDPFNPSEKFAAVMTCSEADKNCPMVQGMEERISLPYVDPKEADGTSYEAARYDERTFQIAAEMFYLMMHVKE